MERTLVLIKPDAVKIGAWLDIIKVYEEEGFKITSRKIFVMPEPIVRELYREHEGKSFYNKLIEFMQSGITIALILTGANAVERVRIINGATNPEEAAKGTIRYEYGSTADGSPENAVHGSASSADAEREIAIVFRK